DTMYRCKITVITNGTTLDFLLKFHFINHFQPPNSYVAQIFIKGKCGVARSSEDRHLAWPENK
ncbi:MAG: hypothetical protein Q4F45_08650, partial [Alistipes sp.]|nr:hypothetical protein [Alistipes sp.]